MDPQATWDRLLCAYAQGDWDTIEECANELLAWLDRGGTPPRVSSQPDLGPEWQAALTKAGCTFALDTVQSEWSIEQ